MSWRVLAADLRPTSTKRLMGHVRTPAGVALSAREREVLALIATGAANSAIAAALFIRACSPCNPP